MGGPVWRNHRGHGRAGAYGSVGEALCADLAGPGGIEGRDGLPPPVPRGERTQVMAAIAGIDIALWDIKGKAAGLPVYRLLGGENRPIFTYATGGYYRPDATNSDYGLELARFLDLGYRAVKLKAGAGTVVEEAARIKAVRDVIGNEPRLMLDMNAAYDFRTAWILPVPSSRADSFGSRSRCTGICSRPISPGWRSRRRSRWRMASAS